MNSQKNINKNDKRWRILMYLSSFVFGVSLLFSVPYLIFYHKSDSPEIIPEEKKELCENCVRRKLDGVPVVAGEDNYYPIAVVFDNHSEARPPAGLSKAGLVYETEAEGRITRYLAIFSDVRGIEKIGPVRSARPYFLDWTNELGALFTHCGGSPEALVKITKDKIINLNEFYNEKSFWRDSDRTASHNLFTSGEKLINYLERKNLEAGEYQTWKFKEDSLERATSSPEIAINYKAPYYSIKWVYSPDSNDYLRHLMDVPHQDENGTEIKAKNIIVKFVATKVLDAELRLQINTIGKNKAIICLDGICQEGEWNKKSATDRTRYYYKNGEEVEFNAGPIWIQVVREGEKIDY